MRTFSEVSAPAAGVSPTIRRKGKIERKTATSPQYDKVALVLQGGGALGSYQAGVIEGLLNANIEPDWVAGISIGALNTAIIAGNAPENRLKALTGFWDTICRPANLPPLFGALGNYASLFGDSARQGLSMLAASRAMMEGQRGFFSPRKHELFPFSATKTPANVSYYDTSALKDTLLKYADFDRINNGSMRVSLGAVNVRSGNFVYFDNKNIVLRPEHFMASGALPPGFPAVEIDGEFYWDGGLVSNTPLSEVLGQQEPGNTLVFQVDLWNAKGSLPLDMSRIAERTKDIQFSSRTRLVTDERVKAHRNALLVKELLELIPEQVRAQNAFCQQAQQVVSNGGVNIIQLIYKNKPFEGHCKDFEFSLDTMQEHWTSGLQDIEASLAKPGWLDVSKANGGVITHDIHR